jgi:hypothetical protein
MKIVIVLLLIWFANDYIHISFANHINIKRFRLLVTFSLLYLTNTHLKAFDSINGWLLCISLAIVLNFVMMSPPTLHTPLLRCAGLIAGSVDCDICVRWPMLTSPELPPTVGCITAYNTLRLVSVQLTAQCCIMDADEVYDGFEGTTKLPSGQAQDASGSTTSSC